MDTTTSCKTRPSARTRAVTRSRAPSPLASSFGATSFHGWGSQAIDITGVADWLIEDNRFHDPRLPQGKAVGAKLGSRDIVIRNNRMVRSGGLSLGGTSAAHSSPAEAIRVLVEGNELSQITGHAFKLYSCQDCEIRGQPRARAPRRCLDRRRRRRHAWRTGPGGSPVGVRADVSQRRDWSFVRTSCGTSEVSSRISSGSFYAGKRKA